MLINIGKTKNEKESIPFLGSENGKELTRQN